MRRRGSEPSGRRVGCRSLSIGDESLEGLHLQRVTQAKRGVVKLQRPDQLRLQAWSIFKEEPQEGEGGETGEGHQFGPVGVIQDWCDACSHRIHTVALRCQNCSYTCHLECKNLVQLDCNQQTRQKEETRPEASCRSPSTPPPAKNCVKEDEAENPQSLTEDEIKSKIEEYNSKASENTMKLETNGTYTGFIKVNLKLRRPVTLLINQAKDSGSDAGTADVADKRTSFYLPKEAIKQLHISNSNTVNDVIQGLLKKFNVGDDPRKFALYKQTHRHGQDLFQKLSDTEHPLYLRLLAGPDLENLSFVMKENETGEVEWHAFSVPELQNFLTILEKEESERVKQVQNRYMAYRQKLSEALQQVQNKPG